MTLQCLCGAVEVTIAQKPEFVNACNCDMCRKSGARWGYFDPSQVTITGPGKSYRRGDKPVPSSEIHFCTTCGATTHFLLTEASVAKFGDTMMGVNMALASENELAGIELRYPDGKSWSGEGTFGYYRENRVLGTEG
nr:aldehyde-activating protein [Qipengyuania algicida]